MHGKETKFIMIKVKAACSYLLNTKGHLISKHLESGQHYDTHDDLKLMKPCTMYFISFCMIGS